eukprot:357633-Chlamydomonas_euryale.AAC.3
MRMTCAKQQRTTNYVRGRARCRDAGVEGAGDTASRARCRDAVTSDTTGRVAAACYAWAAHQQPCYACSPGCGSWPGQHRASRARVPRHLRPRAGGQAGCAPCQCSCDLRAR